MSKEMICPFCQTELDYDEYGWDYACSNPRCQKSLGILSGTESLWQALIQSQRDLQDKKEELEEFKKHHAMWEQIRNNTILALEKDLQIAVGTLRSIGACNNRVSNLALQKMAHECLAQITHDNKD